MKNKLYFRKRLAGLLLVTAFGLCLLPASAGAQEVNWNETKLKVKELLEAQKFTEALPLLEKLTIAEPNNADSHFYLGFALLGQSKNTADAAERKNLRMRARKAFVRSIDLGNDTQLAKAIVGSIPEDGGADPPGFSANAQAGALMDKAEGLFSRGQLDEALAAYQEALKLDPTLYHAALYSGDVHTQRGRYAEAEIWYQKAIAINPNIETAYRYSATPLMKQKKYNEARDRYVEAFIVEPYSRFAISGITQWGEATGTQLGHPKIDIPEVTFDGAGKGNSKIDFNPLADDGSGAWIAYVAARAEWKNASFARKYPGKPYRHTLEEEAAALRSVIKAVQEKKPKAINSQLATLARLDAEGLLEAYILMAHADREIAQDHAEYLKQNRAKLRQYVINYVIGAK